MMDPSEQARAALAERLCLRRAEIERLVMDRVCALPGTGNEPVPECAEGLLEAISAAIGHALTAVHSGERGVPHIPLAMVVRARLCARTGISIDTVLRRYCAGFMLFNDFLISDAANDDRLSGEALRHLSRSQSSLFETTLEKISAEYYREAGEVAGTSANRLAGLVRRLLAGELIETRALEYDLDRHHVAAISRGSQAPEELRRLAKRMGCRALIVRPTHETTWAWLGSRHKMDCRELPSPFSKNWPRHLPLALGEPGHGYSGWRLTHEQAHAAFSTVVSATQNVVHYADVALLASIRRDELLTRPLHNLYLAPLADERDGGATLRDTLRAYFAAGQNGSSAAAALKVSRQTVTNRLKVIEDRLGRPLTTCTGEIEAALRLADVDRLS